MDSFLNPKGMAATRKRSEADLWHSVPTRLVSVALAWLQYRFWGCSMERRASP